MVNSKTNTRIETDRGGKTERDREREKGTLKFYAESSKD